MKQPDMVWADDCARTSPLDRDALWLLIRKEGHRSARSAHRLTNRALWAKRCHSDGLWHSDDSARH
eukprot:4739984-Lingulodinium_polyedra.AAC.1